MRMTVEVVEHSLRGKTNLIAGTRLLLASSFSVLWILGDTQVTSNINLRFFGGKIPSEYVRTVTNDVVSPKAQPFLEFRIIR